MSRVIDQAATDLVVRLRVPVIARGLSPGADACARRLAWAATGVAIAALAVIRQRLGGVR